MTRSHQNNVGTYTPKAIMGIGLKHQSGVVLLVGLIMLLLLTLIGLSGTQVTSLEEKMTGNMKNRNLAFQAAEAALAEGEANVGKPGFPYDCTNARYMPFDRNCDSTLETIPVWDNIDWSATATPLKSIAYTGNLGVSDGIISANPRYIIEYLGVADCVGSAVGANDCHNYRITSRATGGNDTAVAVLQSILLTRTAPPP
jgi:type IV pilus assembly protein PilX